MQIWLVFLFFYSLHLLSYKISIHPWIIDTGASYDMTFDKTLFHNFRSLPSPISVTLPNSHKVKVKYIGDVILTEHIILFNIFYVPSFKHKSFLCGSICGRN